MAGVTFCIWTFLLFVSVDNVTGKISTYVSGNSDDNAAPTTLSSPSDESKETDLAKVSLGGLLLGGSGDLLHEFLLQRSSSIAKRDVSAEPHLICIGPVPPMSPFWYRCERLMRQGKK